ncbi:MAG: hypothetical protein ACLPUO_29680 [Streptosporangiaceae bacterium]|jgi:hypothetical protein
MPSRHATQSRLVAARERFSSASPRAIERMLEQHKATVAAEFAQALLGTLCTSGKHRAGSSTLCTQCSQARADAAVVRQLGGIA